MGRLMRADEGVLTGAIAFNAASVPAAAVGWFRFSESLAANVNLRVVVSTAVTSSSVVVDPLDTIISCPAVTRSGPVAMLVPAAMSTLVEVTAVSD